MSIFSRLFSPSSQKDYNRGIVAFNRGEYEEAIDSFRAVLDSASKGSTVYRLGRFYVTESLARLGHAYFHESKLDGARVAFTKVLEHNPNFPDIHCRLGEIAEHEERIEDAESHFRRALDIHPRYQEARAYLALLLRRVNRHADAVEHFRALADGGVDIPQSWLESQGGPDGPETVERVREAVKGRGRGQEKYRVGLERYQAGDLDGAREAFEVAIESAPDYPDLRCRLATVYGELGRFQDAMRELDKALGLNPSYSEARIKRAIACFEIGRYRQAAEDLTTAVGSEPSNAELRYLIGVALVKAGRADEAVAPLKQAIKSDTVRERAQEALARAYLVLDQTDQAVEYLRDVRSASGMTMLARVQLRHRQWLQATRLLETAASKGESGGGHLIALARAHLGSGNTAAAKTRCDEATAFSEVAAEAWCLLGQLSFEAGDDARALSCLRKAAHEGAGGYGFLVLMGRTLTRMSRFEEATAALEKSLELRPGGREGRRALGLLLQRQGDTERAAELLSETWSDPCDPLWGGDAPPTTGEAWRRAA